MSELELISNYLCPYTQRAGIQLLEKGVPFERIYIDLADKPDWFLELSPLGKVPVLKTPQGAIFETSVICEYIEDAYPHALHPSSPFDRAHHRAWAEFASSIISDVYMFYTAPAEDSFAKKSSDLAMKMGWIDKHLVGTPYFFGDDFSLVDAAYAPIFRLFETFDGIGDFGIFTGHERISDYRAALAERESVRNAVVDDYAQHFVTYLKGQNSYLSAMIPS